MKNTFITRICLACLLIFILFWVTNISALNKIIRFSNEVTNDTVSEGIRTTVDCLKDGISSLRMQNLMESWGAFDSVIRVSFSCSNRPGNRS